MNTFCSESVAISQSVNFLLGILSPNSFATPFVAGEY